MRYPIIQPVAQLYRPAASLRLKPRTEGNYTQQCNVVYAEAHGLGLVMDVFQPLAPPNGLGVVDVVSSGWYADRVVLNQHLGLGLIDALAARGFTVFAVSPGSVTHFTGHEMVRHIHEALRYVKAHAAEYEVLPGALALTGASAGGHLALLAALQPQPGRPSAALPSRRQDTRVAAVAALFPPTDLLAMGDALFKAMREEGAPIEGLLFRGGLDGRSAQEIEEKQRALSPARQVPASPPPALLLHGDADTMVPLSQSESMQAELQAAGGKAELRVKRGGGHPWPNPRPEMDGLAQWLQERLKD